MRDVSYTPVTNSCTSKDGPTCKVRTGVVTRAWDKNKGGYYRLENGKKAIDTSPETSLSNDAGFFMDIDDWSVATDSGFVMEGWSKDVSGIEVGDKVTVIYVTDENDRKTLNCDSCGVFK
jgi:hypothetical protein